MVMFFNKYLFTNNLKLLRNYYRNVSYIQGQQPESRIREYFYYIDHQGMLFLDDAKIKNFTSCFKDKQFLQFFFKRLRVNDTNRYRTEFPFLSICGRERNFIRCDDLPIVYTHVIPSDVNDDAGHLSYGHADKMLTVTFEPDKIYMSPLNGRVYHPVSNRFGSIGLIRSQLAIEFSKHFDFENVQDPQIPTHFTWNNIKYTLNNEWINHLNVKPNLWS